MACEIFKKDFVLVNGSTKAWGGVIQSVTFNLGIGNQKSNASVSVVKFKTGATNSTFSPPDAFTEVTITIGSKKYYMVVKSVSETSSATSADVLRVDCVDNSYKKLDLNLIGLNEAIRGGGGYNKTKPGQYSNGLMKLVLLGDKYEQKSTQDTFGNIVPVPDGQWVKSREYWEQIEQLNQLRKASGITYQGKEVTTICSPAVYAKYGTCAELEDKIINSSGEVLYRVSQLFTEKREQQKYSPKGVPLGNESLDPPFKELNDSISLPANTFGTISGSDMISFTGTYREVMEQLANKYGFFYWWDCTEAEGKLRMSDEIDLAEGYAAIEEIKGKCRVISHTSTTDHSSTYAKAVFSQFDSRWTFTSKSGGEASNAVRYHRATPLTIKFRYRKCWEDSEVKAEELETLGDSGNPSKGIQPQSFTNDQRKAMQAAFYGPSVYAGYVIQSVGAATAGSDIFQNKAKVAGQGGAERNQLPKVLNAQNTTPAAPALQWTSNEFLKEVYSPKGGDGAKTCDCDHDCFCLYPLNFAPGDGNGGDHFFPVLMAFAKDIKGQDRDKAVELGFIGDDGLVKNPVPAVLFGVKRCDGANGTKVQTGSTILKGETVDASKDATYNYLRAIVDFVNRFYVVKRGGSTNPEAWFAYNRLDDGGLRRTFSYHISSQSTPNQLRPQGGGRLISAHPLIRLDQCGISALVNVFKALEYIYTGRYGRVDVSLYPSLIEFVYWIDGQEDENALSDYFTATEHGLGAVQELFSVIPKTRTQMAGEEISPQMHLIDTGTNMQDLVPIPPEVKRFSENIIPVPTDGPAAVTSIGAHLLTTHDMLAYVGVNNDMNGEDGNGDPIIAPISEADLRLDNNLRTLKAFYNVSSGAGNSSSQGEVSNFFCNWLALPTAAKDAKVFNAKLETTEVTASDLGLSNEEVAKFDEFIASPFSGSNKAKMSQLNATKAQASAFADTAGARSERISFLLLSGDSFEMPSQEEGLEGLSISIDGSQATVELTVGNTRAKQVVMNAAVHKLNTALNAYGSSAFGTAPAQGSSAMQFLGLGG